MGLLSPGLLSKSLDKEYQAYKASMFWRLFAHGLGLGVIPGVRGYSTGVISSQNLCTAFSQTQRFLEDEGVGH